MLVAVLALVGAELSSQHQASMISQLPLQG
jgi:hypothetical protein